MLVNADIVERFGLRVRELRKKASSSQEASAAKCGLDRAYIGGIERGKRNVASRNLGVIANPFGKQSIRRAADYNTL